VEALSRFLASEPLTHVFSSPLQRARATAEAVALPHGLAVNVRESLIELDVGETEGMTFDAVRQRWPEFGNAWLGPDVADAVMPGGESLRDLSRRLSGFVSEVKELPAESDVAVVAHNFVIKVLICELLGAGIESFRAFDVGLASKSAVTITNSGRALVGMLNDTCHLDGLNLEVEKRSV